MAYRTQDAAQQAIDTGRRQSLSRELNERIEELSRTFELGEGIRILCECGSAGCDELILLSETEYEDLRRIPTHFAVLPGHDNPEMERIVEQHRGFVLVEKLGESAVTAIKLDPRRGTR